MMRCICIRDDEGRVEVIDDDCPFARAAAERLLLVEGDAS